jgi:bacterioferritin
MQSILINVPRNHSTKIIHLGTLMDTQKIVEHLNKILANELTAINQYFLHAKMLKHMGYQQLAETTMQESIDEMKHAEILTERILFLGGIPNMQSLGKLLIGETPQEMLNCDLQLEQAAISNLREAIHYCESQKDYHSHEILNTILANEEEHLDFLEKQLRLIASLGEQNYLQSQV